MNYPTTRGDPVTWHRWRLRKRRCALLVILLGVAVTLYAAVASDVFVHRRNACQIEGDVCEAYTSLRGQRILVKTARNGAYLIEGGKVKLFNWSVMQTGAILINKGGGTVPLDGTAGKVNRFEATPSRHGNQVHFVAMPLMYGSMQHSGESVTVGI